MQSITVSQTGAGNSRPIRLDDFAPSGVALQVDVTGTVTYTVQSSLDDPNDPMNPTPAGSMTWVASADSAVVSATTTQQSNYLFSPKFIRVVVSAGSGTAALTVLQSSSGPR